MQHTEEQPASASAPQFPSEWGGTADQQTGEVSASTVPNQRGHCNM